MPSPVTKTCIALWPGHGQLRVEYTRYMHQGTERPVPVPPLGLLFSLYYSSFSTPCPLKAVITLFLSPNNTDNFTFCILYGTVSTL